MSFCLARRKLRPLEWIQKCWKHFYCFLVKEIPKWAEIFTGWFYYISLDSCKVWKHLQTLIPIVCNGFNSGLASTTIKNYCSAVVAIYNVFLDGSSMSHNPAITQLIQGLFVQRPPVSKLMPSWDLFQVLSALSEAPFEPLAQALLMQLSIKVAFLLAVATTRRWLRLIPNAELLKKNQLETFCPNIYSRHYM